MIFLQKICHVEFFGHFEFLRKRWTITKILSIKKEVNQKKINFQVLNNKNVLTSILNLGAILIFLPGNIDLIFLPLNVYKSKK
jgi:hypothetical protein